MLFGISKKESEMFQKKPVSQTPIVKMEARIPINKEKIKHTMNQLK
jgi:hypothetical protein